MEAREAKMANTCVLNVKRLTENASLPTRGSAHAAGYDLYRCVVFGRRQMFINFISLVFYAVVRMM